MSGQTCLALVFFLGLITTGDGLGGPSAAAVVPENCPCLFWPRESSGTWTLVPHTIPEGRCAETEGQCSEQASPCAPLLTVGWTPPAGCDVFTKVIINGSAVLSINSKVTLELKLDCGDSMEVVGYCGLAEVARIELFCTPCGWK